MPGIGVCRPNGIDVGEPHPEVRFFKKQPSSWTEPRDHSPEDFGIVGDVHQHGASVYEIERSLRERVGAEVVTEHFNVRRIDRGEKVQLEVCRRHFPIRAYELGKPTRDRATSAADFETRGSRADGEPLDPPLCQWIEPLLK